MQEQYRIHTKAAAISENIICFGKFRFTMLTDRLIRIEYAEAQEYTDMPTQTVWFRAFPKVDYKVTEEPEKLRIETEFLTLCCENQGKNIEDFSVICSENRWRYGDCPATLKGTVRTLDGVDGAVPLEDGLQSVEGYSVLEDSNSYLIRDDGELTGRTQEEIDIYFFGYGNCYRKCLQDYFMLTEQTPLLPRYALGNWWSRFHRYTETEYLDLMGRFEAYGIPLTVAVIDMDWHLTDIEPKYGSGWTGYTWNRELFPDPERFMEKLHHKGLKVSLNVHPADGVRAYEEPYREMVSAVGEALNVHSSKEDPIKFDATNPVFMEAYFEYLHVPNEKMGVDFWWVDWQQGETSKLPGLDPLWVLNHYHYLHSARTHKRPMILSRFAGAGSHRYPIGFSGDTIISWESLNFQPYFTATASNIGYGWWSHDIGGHMQGSYDEELQIRWVQWGVFSPINRMHSSASEFTHKEPWNYSPETCRIITDYLRLRHRLIPYLYTMNMRSYQEGKMLIEPMYYEYPEKKEAYTVPNEYYFGTEMICLPVTTPMADHLQMAEVKGWLPQGTYIDWRRGTIYDGDRYVKLYRRLDEIPVFLKAGAIIVCDGNAEGNAVANPEKLRITVAAGADGQFTLYEDDGESLAYLKGEGVYTEFQLHYTQNSEFCILPARGNQELIPSIRHYEIHFLGFEGTGNIVMKCGEQVEELPVKHDSDKNEMVVDVEGNIGSAIKICFMNGMKLGRNQVRKLCFDILDKAKMAYNRKEEIYDVIKHTEGCNLMQEMKLLKMDTKLADALTEAITAQE